MAARPPLSGATGLGRRALLGAGLAGVVAGVAAACGSEAAPVRRVPSDRTRRSSYGDAHPDQYGVLRLPARSRPLATVVLLHGGFWQARFGLDLMDDLADVITGLGHPTWNLEYRRLGEDGGFPATFEDVAAGVDHLAELGRQEGLDLAGDVVLLGHSAGGHLAVWAASRTATTPGGAPRVVPRATIALAGVLDLARGQTTGVGGGTIDELMGGRADDEPDAYRLGDPIALVPAQGRVFAVAAEGDTVVPLEQSTAYIEAARDAGATAELVRVPGNHFTLIDPGSEGWPTIRDLLAPA